MRLVLAFLVPACLLLAGCAAPQEAGADAVAYVNCPVAAVDARWENVPGPEDIFEPSRDVGYAWDDTEGDTWTWHPELSETNAGFFTWENGTLHMRAFETIEGTFRDGPEAVASAVGEAVNETYPDARLVSWEAVILDDICGTPIPE